MDRKLRDLQRLAKTGDSHAEEQYLYDSVRHNNRAKELKILAMLDHPAALGCVKNNPQLFNDDSVYQRVADVARGSALGEVCDLVDIDLGLEICKTLCGYSIGVWKRLHKQRPDIRGEYQSVYLISSIDTYYEILNNSNVYLQMMDILQTQVFMQKTDKQIEELAGLKIARLTSTNRIIDIIILCFKIIKIKAILKTVSKENPSDEISISAASTNLKLLLASVVSLIVSSSAFDYDEALTAPEAYAVIYALIQQQITDHILRHRFELKD